MHIHSVTIITIISNSTLQMVILPMYQTAMYGVQVDTSNIDWGFLKPFGGVGFPSYLIFDSWWLLPGFRPQISLNSPAGMRKDPSMELLRIGQLKGLSSPDPREDLLLFPTIIQQF